MKYSLVLMARRDGGKEDYRVLYNHRSCSLPEVTTGIVSHRQTQRRPCERGRTVYRQRDTPIVRNDMHSIFPTAVKEDSEAAGCPNDTCR